MISGLGPALEKQLAGPSPPAVLPNKRRTTFVINNMAERMFCPRCSAAFEAGIAFCRTCGLSLSEVAAVVTGEGSDEGEVVSKPNFRAIRLGIGLFIVGTVLGLIHTALRDFQLFPEAYGKVVFLAFVASGLLCIGLAFLFPSTVYKRKKGQRSRSIDRDTTELEGLADSPELGQAPANIELKAGYRNDGDAATHSPGSVTETTTRKLKVQ